MLGTYPKVVFTFAVRCRKNVWTEMVSVHALAPWAAK
jgi:hypothetical protein